MLNGQIKLKCPICTLQNLDFKTVSVPVISDSWYDDYYWARTCSGDADSTKVMERPKRFVNPELKNK